MGSHRWRSLGVLVGIVGVSAAVFGVSSGGAASAPSLKGVSITLEGPNQWTNSGRDFGAPWDAQVARFEKRTGIKVKTVVLPLSTFGQTESTQLAAGTAPELVFNQAAYKPQDVTPLDAYLHKPNPFGPAGKPWIADFNPAYYGRTMQLSLHPPTSNPGNHLYWVPFNLLGVALYTNQEAFAKAGVKGPITTWAELAADAPKFAQAGYTPLAMDNSQIGTGWSVGTILNMMLSKYYTQWNHFDATGKIGSNPTLTIKDLAWAIKTGKLNAQLPEVGETLALGQELFSKDATPNWSGIQGLSGSVVGLADFLSGKAAMAWGVDFGYGALGPAKFKVGSQPFPTITKDTTPLSSNASAQFGVTTGGTSYMIPSSTKGDKLAAAVEFMQYMSSPNVAPWVAATGGIPAVTGIKNPSTVSGFLAGTWGQQMKINVEDGLRSMDASGGADFQQTVEGYLLGTSSLSDTESALDKLWAGAATYQIKQNKWGSESWAH